ncbi:MAG TPA: LCP family protein [Nitriliruptorales bacterium]|nr:LCP family protein [Nitriliruptorales bacterium]
MTVAVIAVGVGAVALSLYRLAHGNVERISLPALAEKTSSSEPLNVLVVGSDSREGLTAQEIESYRLGDFSGQRGDTVVLVSITPDREDVRVVSFPRDLVVVDGQHRRKLTETFSEGPDHVVEVLTAATGIAIHHYVEVSIPGFLSVVDAVGGVDLCIDYPLRDEKSGADFDAGCHALSPPEALAFVRARNTPLGDFDRIERQQEFMRALLDRLVATRTVVDVPRLFSVVERVSRNVTTDSALGVGEMKALARELRGLAEGQVPMLVVPTYTDVIDGKSYVVPYGPGAEALYASLRHGVPTPSRGTQEDRAATGVTVWSTGRPAAADLVGRTLHWAAFGLKGSVEGPLPRPPPRTVVYAAPGSTRRAAWVAATLGATVQRPPIHVEFPEGAQVIVVVGADAPPPDDAGRPRRQETAT